MREPNDYVTVTRKGREKGVNIYIDYETWKNALNNLNIPENIPLSKLRIKRYQTKKNIIIKIKMVKTK